MRFMLQLLMLWGVLFLPLHAGAITLTPDQMQKIQQLSPADREALAKQAGVSAAGAQEKSIHSPPVIRSRTVGSGPLEAEVGDNTGDGSVDMKLQAAEVSRSAEADVPIDKVSGNAGADQVEIRRAFADFVSESKSLTIDASNLKQFGYDLFAGSPTTFAPATDVPVPPEYVLGPGDELEVQMFGARNEQFTLVVDREGAVAFPEIGPIVLANISFADAKALLAQQVGEKMIGVTASVGMGKLRSIRIFALGEVAQPGSYVVSGLATLSHALLVSGGVKKTGSLRNVQLKRDGKAISSVDLYDFLLKGDTSGDMRLLPGDVVFIPPIGATVGIAGEVIRPAIYEVGGQTDVGDVVRLAGGFLPHAFLDKALLERINASSEKSVMNISLKDKGINDTQVRNGDVIKVFAALEHESNPVLLIGNVKRPGKYAWKKGLALSSLLPEEDALLPETFMDYGLIEREAMGNREPEVVRFKLADLFLKGEQLVDIYLMPRDKVYVFHRAHFREAPNAMIAGSIKSPGQYALKKEMRILDLILAAGGTTRDTSFEEAELYRTDPVSKEVYISRFSVRDVMRWDATANQILQDQDKIVIHSIRERQYQKYVSIQGEVNHPGEFSFGEGMRISDLIFAAGGVTEKAQVETAELTRYDIVDGKKRLISHHPVDLASVLAGDLNENIQLQPFDVMQVRIVENWKPAMHVILSGEFRYPGSYTVEEGESLQNVIERAGGFTEDAYVDAARFSRTVIREQQQLRLDEMVSRLERELVATEATFHAVRDEKILADKQKGLSRAKAALEQLKGLKPDGRLMISLSHSGQLKGDASINLTDGDALHVPKRPDQVLVMGEVYGQSAMLYQKHMDMDDYIDLAGGVTNLADEDRVYIVRASGYVESGRGWSRVSNVYPGDAIIVPQKLELFSLLDTTLDWSKVLMQIGMFTASMVTVGIL